MRVLVVEDEKKTASFIRKALPAVFVLAGIVLVGCARFEPQKISPMETAAALENRSLDDSGLRSFIEKNLGRGLKKWPPKAWDLELLTLAAYYFQPSLDVARAEWRTAAAGAISAGARPNPTVSFSPGYTVNAASGVSPWLAAAGFDWPVETAGKRGLRIQRAKQFAESAHLNLISTAWKVCANVRDSLAAYRFAGSQASALEQKVALQKQIVSRLEERLNAGAIASSEVMPARIALQKTELESSLAHENETSSQAHLAEAIGIPARIFKNLPMALSLYTPELDDASLAEARKNALQNRADIRIALADFDAAQTSLRLEIAKQYPDIHFSPNYEYDQGDNKWRLGVSLELPLLNRNQGPIAEAKAKRDEATARFTALQAKVISEIDSAAKVFQTARKRAFEIQPALENQRKQENAVAVQVEAGEADSLDLLNVKLEKLTLLALNEEIGYHAEQAFGQLEDSVQSRTLSGEKRGEAIAALPPENLDQSPRIGDNQR